VSRVRVIGTDGSAVEGSRVDRDAGAPTGNGKAPPPSGETT
jgi:hypothetical protein